MRWTGVSFSGPISETDPMTSPTTGRQGPRSIWFVIGGVLIALGVIGGIVVVVIGARQIASTVDDYQRVSASTGGDVFLEDPGTYRIFYEAPGAADGFVSPPPYDIVDPNGNILAVRSDSTSEDYTFGSREGRKIGKFTAPTAGTYGVRVLRGDGLSLSGPQIAIGKRGPTGSIFTILGGVFGGLGVAATGGVMLIVAGVKRGRAKRAHLSPAPGWGVWPQWGGTQPGWAPPQPGWAPPPAPGSWGAPQTGGEIPASEWGAPPAGGVVPQGTQWGARPEPPDPTPEHSAPPGWAPPPTAAPPRQPTDQPPPSPPPPPYRGPIT